jgi:DNA-directed RNA polymerase specialized sigma24 family protein
VHVADDAVQESWLRLQRSDVTDSDDLPGWLNTVVSRICLDQLRARASRREELGVLTRPRTPLRGCKVGRMTQDPLVAADSVLLARSPRRSSASTAR